jgi:hypothetical protein
MKKTQFILLGLIVLIISLIWEFLHFPLYYDLTGIPKILHIITASFVDVFWIFLIFAIVSLINGSIKWIKKPNKKDYFLIVIFGLITAILIEIINLSLGRWAYKEIMPVIFGVGVSPLLQLATTGVLSLLILKKLNP